MASDPYTIHIFVTDGDPEGVRIVERMNWTGKGLVFPRSKWTETKFRPEFGFPGVYILVGPDVDDLRRIYIGEGDGIKDRIDSHYKNKDFWTWAVAFVSANRSLNKAHVQWLEYALVDKAAQAKRCHLDNGNVPQEPALTEADRADTRGFLKEILLILPLVNLREFELPVAVEQPAVQPVAGDPDTIIVPAQKDGFEETFIGEQCWYAIRIAGGMQPKLKWIAAYQTAPISAVTHVAPVHHIEPYGEGDKFKVVFASPAQTIAPIPFADAPQGSMQGPRYTTIEKLRSAKKLGDLMMATKK